MTRVETSVCVCVCKCRCSPTLGNERIMILQLSAFHPCSSKWAPVAYKDNKFRSNFGRLSFFKHTNCNTLSHTHSHTDGQTHPIMLSPSPACWGCGNGGENKQTTKKKITPNDPSSRTLKGISTSFIATLMHLVEKTVVNDDNMDLFYIFKNVRVWENTGYKQTNTNQRCIKFGRLRCRMRKKANWTTKCTLGYFFLTINC